MQPIYPFHIVSGVDSDLSTSVHTEKNTLGAATYACFTKFIDMYLKG